MNKNKQSDSRFQKIDIEKHVIENLKKDLELLNEPRLLNIKPNCTINKTDTIFEFDFSVEDEKIIGEIYAGIEELKSGQKRKIATDILKMIYFEKLSGFKIEKYLILVDNKIRVLLENDKSWLSKLIKSYCIILHVVQLDEELMNKLKSTKERQKR